ncbi:structural ppiase-like protein [Tupanvirus deep ocean]|uniref:Structural ppiase-like protein n=2 Tax=Tupanvirus TaxID=2094720 RepID=A0AC62AA98_9VIRU|nr:structural ppiase-like protein [Tupanvirus deep ocean]QKU34553.1 structural ppiase-like protein [Tupanvirus deep ocean]
MSTFPIIENIADLLREIEDWDIDSFEFNPPVSDFSDEKDIINVDNLMSPPDFNECEELAKDQFGKSIKLNNTQLQQLRKKGTFKIPSKRFEDQDHVWCVSKFLQSGTDNLKESFLNGLAKSGEHFVVYIPNRMYAGKYFTLFGSIKQIISSIIDIPSILIGNRNMQNKYPNHIIHAKLKEFMEETVVSTMIRSYDEGKNKIVFESNEGVCVGIIISKYNQMLEKLKIPYQDFKYAWDKNTVSRRKELHTIHNDNVLSQNDIAKIVVNKENEILQQEIYDLIKRVLDKEDADSLVNLIESISYLRNYVIQYEKNKLLALQDYQKSLKEKNIILSRIDQWVNRKTANFEKDWINKNPIDNMLLKLSENLNGQEKCVFDTHLNIKKSPEYSKLEKELKSEKIPSRVYKFYFKIWNHNKWKIINKNGRHRLNKYSKVTTSTSYPGWRIANLAMGAASLFNNGVNFLLSNMVMGKFGFRSMYGLKDFSADYDVDHEGVVVTKYTFKTWFGRLASLYDNISKSIADFENKPEHGILGKSFTRIFNRIWNYVFKGFFGTILISVGHPLLVLINTIISIAGTLTSPLWAILGALLIYLFCIFIYDLDSPNDNQMTILPLFRTVLDKFLVRGIMQMLGSLIGIGFHVIAGLLTFAWSGFINSIKYCYDSTIYHTVLKFKARLPSGDDFLVKRVSGPGLSTKYFYLIDHDLALVLIQYILEEMEMEAYKQQMKNKINKPRNDLLEFYDRFNIIGLKANHENEHIKGFTATRDTLEKKLSEIENDYWKSHKIRNSIKGSNNIRMDTRNLSTAINKGAEICEAFVPDRILARLGPASTFFWVHKNLERNDWHGLATYCLKRIFGESIVEPFENTDTDGFHLVVKETNAKKLLSKLFKGNIDDNMELETQYPVLNFGLVESDVKVVTPDNVFSQHPYESMLVINDKYLKNNAVPIDETVVDV